MLTDLSFLDIGQKFPPSCESERLEMYRDNKDLFESKHVDVYKEQLKRIERVIGNFDEVFSYSVILNFQKLISLKTADLLLGKPPEITLGEIDSKEQKAVETIAKNSDLINTLNEIAIDISRYGDGLLYIRNNGKGGIIDVAQPSLWFPVVSPDNAREILYHVLAWTTKTIQNNNEITKLKVMIHSKGSYEKREYLVEGSTILKSTKAPEIIKTGLDDFADWIAIIVIVIASSIVLFIVLNKFKQGNV